MKSNENIEHKRHTLAHLLASAVLEIYPDTKNTIGPAIDNGFYYDFEFKSAISDADLKEIQTKMKKLLNTWEIFEKIEVSADQAKAIFASNPYKIELVNEIIAKNEPISVYYSGLKNSIPSIADLLATSHLPLATGFFDLCRGGHLENPKKEIDTDSFKLTRLAGAYWRGNEKNKMLTRIYGLAFDTKEELVAYEKNQEEAKKRDHRKIGKELDLFTISELVGSGLPLFTPKGSVLRDVLGSYSQELQAECGFQRVWTPHMARTELYKHSGHYDKYPERFEVTSAESSDVFMLKPMNCPHHAQLFARKPWSYKELPVKYMENTTNYRDEKHGELHGLSRVRALSQDDGHIFCQEIHIEEEIRNLIHMIKQLYTALKLDYKVRMSFRDGSDKFLGDKEMWVRAENILNKLVKEENLETVPGPGEAAFYGPKLDYLVYDALGREWQCATIQLDFVQPERFGLSYVDSDGKEKRPVMIHKALLGSLERFISIYIEHTAGNFPLWLSPVQIKVIPIGEEEVSYAEKFYKLLRENNIRAEIDKSNDSFGKKVRSAKTDKVPYFAVIGKKEIESGAVTLESRNGSLGAMPKEEILKKLLEEIKNRV